MIPPATPDAANTNAANSEPDAAALRRLAPYLVGSTRRGVVGGSRYARNLRAAIAKAAQDPQQRPVLIKIGRAHV